MMELRVGIKNRIVSAVFTVFRNLPRDVTPTATPPPVQAPIPLGSRANDLTKETP